MASSSFEAQPPGKEFSVFKTTHWSVVLNASNGTNDSAEALHQLCTAYWYPLYVYVRRRGYSREDAEDLTQGFFAVILRKNYIERADPGRGRFRTFLLASIDNFICNEWDRASAKKRGGGQKIISWEEQEAEGRYLKEPVDKLTPQRIFEKRWASTLLEAVLQKLRGELSDAGRNELFEAVQPYLWKEDGVVSYANLAERLKMSAGTLKVTVHRMRQRYRDLLRGEIAQTVADPAEVDDEIRYLLRIMSE